MPVFGECSSDWRARTLSEWDLQLREQREQECTGSVCTMEMNQKNDGDRPTIRLIDGESHRDVFMADVLEQLPTFTNQPVEIVIDGECLPGDHCASTLGGIVNEDGAVIGTLGVTALSCFRVQLRGTLQAGWIIDVMVRVRIPEWMSGARDSKSVLCRDTEGGIECQLVAVQDRSQLGRCRGRLRDLV